MEGKFLTTAEVAEICRTTPATVRWWRQRRRGPRSFRAGRRVLYAVTDLEEWLEGRRAADDLGFRS